MSKVWLIVSFMAGWAVCWYFGAYVLRKVFRSSSAFTRKTIAGLPQDSLLKVWAACEDEIAKRELGTKSIDPRSAP